jgi:hypothetical protein
MQPYALTKGISDKLIDERAMAILSAPEQDDLSPTDTSSFFAILLLSDEESARARASPPLCRSVEGRACSSV